MVLMLPALVWTWILAGTLAYAGRHPRRQGDADNVGVLLRCLHSASARPHCAAALWLPAAMVAPTPVSALLHAVAVVKAGVFTVLKVVVYIFGIETLAYGGAGDWLLYAAAFTVIAASLVALRQDNLKARLAYSTVSQLSYVVLAAAILTPISAVGAALHIAAHAVSRLRCSLPRARLHRRAQDESAAAVSDGACRGRWARLRWAPSV